MRNDAYVPIIIEQTSKGERAYDIRSRLLKDRIIILGETIDEDISNLILSQLLFLEKEDKSKEITMYINSPGGSVTDTLMIYDAMQMTPCPVATICTGMASSGAAVVLAGGKKGKRGIFPNARVMIHQPWGGCHGDASQIEIAANEFKKMKEQISGILAEHTGHSLEKILKDSDRDFNMSAEEALNYNIVDKIIKKRKSGE